MAQEQDDNLIKVTVRRHEKCFGCGKVGSQEKTFSRALSPLERDALGRRHTEETLKAELEHQADEWKQTKYWHPGCRDIIIENLLQWIDQLDDQAGRYRDMELALIEDSSDPAIAAWMQRHGFTIADKQPA